MNTTNKWKNWVWTSAWFLEELSLEWKWSYLVPGLVTYLLTLEKPFNPIESSFLYAAKSLQSCLTLCDPVDGSPPGSPVPGILQARKLEWGAISFSNAGKWKVRVKLLSRVGFFATPWTAAHQAPPSMGFSRQECWSGVPLPSPLVFCIERSI